MRENENANVIPFRKATGGGYVKANWLAHLKEGTIFGARYKPRDLRYLVEKFTIVRHYEKTTSLLTESTLEGSVITVHTFDFSQDWEKVEIYGYRDWTNQSEELVGDVETEGFD